MFPYTARIDPAKRIGATAIDFIIAWVGLQILEFLFWDTFALLIIWLLILLKDTPIRGMFGGVSPGKRLMGLRVIRQKGITMDATASFKRNLPLFAGVAVYLAARIVFAFVPFLGEIVAKTLGTIAGSLALVTEIYKMYRDPEGERIGDLLAGTLVVEDP